MLFNVGFAFATTACALLTVARTITIKDTASLLALLDERKLSLFPDPTITSDKTMHIPLPLLNNTNNFLLGPVKRDTTWGNWNGLMLVINWNNKVYTPGWNDRIRNEVADQAANRGWSAWSTWADMNFHATYAGDSKRQNDNDGGFTIVTPGPIADGNKIMVDPHSAYTYIYNPSDAALRLDTIRHAFFADTSNPLKRLQRQLLSMDRPSFNMAFTKPAGPACEAEYGDFYSAAYHAAYVSMGTGTELCGYFTMCCDNGCEAMQFQCSNQKDNVNDLWGTCLQVNRNVKWYNYGFW